MWGKLGGLNWFLQFLCGGLSFFNLILLFISMVLQFMWEKDFFCAGLISKTLQILTMFSTGFTSLRVLLLFPLSVTFFIFIHGFWCQFGDFNDDCKDWLTYSGGTDSSGELCYNFSISNDLTKMANRPTWIVTVTLTVLLFLIYLLLLTLIFVIWLSMHWEILIMWLSHFSLTFHQTQNRTPCFIA